MLSGLRATGGGGTTPRFGAGLRELCESKPEPECAPLPPICLETELAPERIGVGAGGGSATGSAAATGACEPPVSAPSADFADWLYPR